MNAVGAGLSCCRWLACASSAKEGLKGRVCGHWRVIPGILALVATVVAIVCAVLWHSPYLCIAYAPGGIASIYLIYLGWDFQNSKTFTENNAQFDESVHSFKAENEVLHGQVRAFEEENKKLQESVTRLSELVENLKSQTLDLTKANEDLKGTILTLEELKNTLEQKAAKHVEQLENLSKSLIGIEAAAKEDHTTFAVNLEVFVKHVQLLQQAPPEFAKIGSSVEKKMQEQVDVLLKAAGMLQTIFTQINEWKDKKAVARRIEEQQLLNKNILALEIQLAKGDGRIGELNKQIEELAKLRDGFIVALKDLLQEIAKLRELKGELSIEIEKVAQAAKVFQNYGLGHTN